MPIIRAEKLEKTFTSAAGAKVMAVRGVDLSVDAGEFVAITGASGSGKSTLLHILGGITRPTTGCIFLEDTDLATLDDDALAAIRRRRIGFVFQRYNLLPELTLIENVALPLVLDGGPSAAATTSAREALAAVGMDHRADHRPDALSGGEQQRGAVARALVTNPAIVLADEPTGALDSENSAVVLDLLRRVVTERNQTLVLITHDPGVAAAADRIVRMRDGRISKIVTGDGALVPSGAERP